MTEEIRPPCCIIGAQSEAEQINAALREGQGLGTVAKRYGLVKGTLGKHRAKCLGIVMEQAQQGGGAPTETGAETPRRPPGGSSGDRPVVQSRARVKSLEKSTPIGASLPAGDGGTKTPPDDGDGLPPAPTNREGRVRAVIDLMSANRWVKGETGPLVAAAWGLSPATLEQVAAEAHRRIVATIDPDVVRSRLCTALDHGLTMAIVNEDPKGLAQVAKTYADITGVMSPKKHELTGKDGIPLGLPPILAALSPPPTVEELELFAQTGKLPDRPKAQSN